MVSGCVCAGAETLDELGILPPIRNHEDAVILSVRNALRSDDFRAAAAAITLLAQKLPGTGRAEYWTGVLDLRRGNFEEAIRSFRRSQAAANDPYTAEGLGLAYYAVRQFRLFQMSMTQASTQLPNDFSPNYFLGRYYASTDVADFKRAKSYLAIAVLRNPSHVLARYYLGLSEECLREAEQSAASYKQALALAARNDTPSALSYLGLARLSILQGQPSEALGYAQKAQAALPHNAEVYQILGKLHAQTGQLQSAIREWETAASLDPTGTTAYYNLFRLYTTTHQPEKADQALAKYKEMASLYGSE